MDERGGDRGGQAVAHRARRRAEERARAGGSGSRGRPSSRSCRRRSSRSRRRAGPAGAWRRSGPDGRPGRPTACRRRRTRPPTRPDRRRCCAWRVGDESGIEDGATEESLVGRLQERLGIRRDREARAPVDPPARARHEVDVRPALAGARHRVAERRHLVEARPDDEHGIGARRAAPGPTAAARSRPSRGTADGRSRSRRPRRQDATTGTWRSSAKRVRSVDVRARRTPAPARMTGRSARGEELDDVADLVVGGARDGRAGRRRPRRRRASSRRAGPREATGGPGRAGR